MQHRLWSFHTVQNLLGTSNLWECGRSLIIRRCTDLRKAESPWLGLKSMVHWQLECWRREAAVRKRSQQTFFTPMPIVTVWRGAEEQRGGRNLACFHNSRLHTLALNTGLPIARLPLVFLQKTAQCRCYIDTNSKSWGSSLKRRKKVDWRKSCMLPWKQGAIELLVEIAGLRGGCQMIVKTQEVVKLHEVSIASGLLCLTWQNGKILKPLTSQMLL